MQEYYVYKHINKINGKQYIGITKQLPKNRWGKNGINYKKSCPHFWNAIQKYGWDSFEHIVLYESLSKEQACKIEIQLIKELKTQDRKYGYNVMEGGSAPSIPEEIKKKMSQSMQGNTNGLGHPCSEEKKKKISEAQKGRKLTSEHKAKLSKAKKGKSHKPPSDETKKKISDSHKKSPVYCLETDTIYVSIQECSRQLGIEATTICACCKGKHKTAKGYHFQYYNDTINA